MLNVVSVCKGVCDYCTFSNNTAKRGGGAIMARKLAKPNFLRSYFINNRVDEKVRVAPRALSERIHAC